MEIEKEEEIVRCLKKGMSIKMIQTLKNISTGRIREIRDKYEIPKPDMKWRGNIMV